MIQKGDRVQIKKEWMDAGDTDFEWYAEEDQDGDRVLIQAKPVNGVKTAMILASYVVLVAWLDQ